MKLELKIYKQLLSWKNENGRTASLFLRNPFDMANIKSFIKVFEVKGIVVSVGAFHYEEYLVEKKRVNSTNLFIDYDSFFGGI